VVRRTDADAGPEAPRPTLIHAYGGWNTPLVPAWIGPFAPFVDAGGAFVIAHVRGGGEQGERHWQDGMLGAKQNGFDDLYAVADELVARGRTTARQLAFVGGSNGSLHAGAAINQRPDLFAAIVSAVPISDMMKAMENPFLAGCADEYGDPSNPRDAQWIYAYSPYHNVRAAAHPATLVCSAENDRRCPSWHARKHVARLQATNEGERPVLLRAWPDGGHFSVLGHPEHVAEWLGFAMEHVGLEPVAR
jgi:prolyl oligopeptidase